MGITESNRKTLATLARFEKAGGGAVSPETLQRWNDRHFYPPQLQALRRRGLIETLASGVRLTKRGQKILESRKS